MIIQITGRQYDWARKEYAGRVFSRKGGDNVYLLKLVGSKHAKDRILSELKKNITKHFVILKHIVIFELQIENKHGNRLLTSHLHS